MAIQRLLLIDRNAIEEGMDIEQNCKPDAIKELPGLMPTVIDQLRI
ncbi:glycerol-3-phosphate responsive antiterminator [Rossellomorea sp. NPDC071047]